MVSSATAWMLRKMLFSMLGLSRLRRRSRILDVYKRQAPENTSLHDCNNIIWDNKINTLPLVDAEGNLKYMVFRKDYDLSLIHI